MHIYRHTHTSTHVQSAHKRKGDNQAQKPGWEGQKKGFVRDHAHTHIKKNRKKNVRKNSIFTNLKKRFDHIERPAKLLDWFLRSKKRNINQLNSPCLIAMGQYAYCYSGNNDFESHLGEERPDSPLETWIFTVSFESCPPHRKHSPKISKRRLDRLNGNVESLGDFSGVFHKKLHLFSADIIRTLLPN